MVQAVLEGVAMRAVEVINAMSGGIWIDFVRPCRIPATGE